MTAPHIDSASQKSEKERPSSRRQADPRLSDRDYEKIFDVSTLTQAMITLTARLRKSGNEPVRIGEISNRWPDREIFRKMNEKLHAAEIPYRLRKSRLQGPSSKKQWFDVTVYLVKLV